MEADLCRCSKTCFGQIHETRESHDLQTAKRKQLTFNQNEQPLENHEDASKSNTCGKHIGIPPRIAFGGLKMACKGVVD